jgi:DNA-binding GntR family transcriptional regulator
MPRNVPIRATSAFGLEALPGSDELSAAEFVYRQMLDAVLSQRLLAGARLQEQILADIFSVGRAPIRSALQRLASDGVVDVLPNRGASVSRPEVDEVHDLFDARRVIECELFGRSAVCHRKAEINASELVALRAHATREAEHIEAARRGAALRRACGFHVDLARLAGNASLVVALERMVIRIALAIGIYEKDRHDFDGPTSRLALINTLGQGDVRSAKKAMRVHLDAMQASLDLNDKAGTDSLGAAFAHLATPT